ncbi:hypothetical protein BGX38DRAFT_1267463 [Terfezia claveryi]|nr:hypothetical protein BGX38DRAFT_1267463 [Terfezia claveryi]
MITAGANGGKVRFSYNKALDSNTLMFLVDVDENTMNLPSRPLVKFSAGIHKECADLGIELKLYEFGSLAGGWHMVVMEYMTGYKMLVEFGPDTHIRDGVKDAITKLQSHGYVHGDIREVNIMVCGTAGDSPLRVVLVDWDGPVWREQLNIPRHQDAMALCPI